MLRIPPSPASAPSLVSQPPSSPPPSPPFLLPATTMRCSTAMMWLRVSRPTNTWPLGLSRTTGKPLCDTPRSASVTSRT